MSELDNIQKVFNEATSKMKQRVGYLEHQVKEKNDKVGALEIQIKELATSLKETENGLTLWESTAENRKTFLDEYKVREQDAFGMVVKSVIDYMDEYELFKESVNRYGGSVFKGFKGLNAEQKKKYNAYIKKKTQELTNYVKRLKDGKV